MKKQQKQLLTGLVILLILTGLGVGLYFLLRDDKPATAQRRANSACIDVERRASLAFSGDNPIVIADWTTGIFVTYKKDESGKDEVHSNTLFPRPGAPDPYAKVYKSPAELVPFLRAHVSKVGQLPAEDGSIIFGTEPLIYSPFGPC
jgi:hypothetical protein